MSPLVLCYHALSERWDADLAVTPARFESQLALLIRRGYRGATFEEAATGTPGAKVLAITFDDAFRSVFDLAYPIMARLGLPGTLFVPTDYPDRDEPMAWPGIDRWVGTEHEGELVSMTWAQIAELSRAGWEIGSHARSHPHLTGLDDDALSAELTGSREECERRLGRPCTSIAYPYGDHDSRVVAAAAAAGYSAGATLPTRFRDATPLEWPRVGIYSKDGGARFRAKVSPTVRHLRATRCWELLERAERPAGALTPGRAP